MEQKQKQLEQRALEVDRGFEQMQRDGRELEEQAKQLDEWHNRLAGEAEQLAEQKKEQADQIRDVERRRAALEGQQAMLATCETGSADARGSCPARASSLAITTFSRKLVRRTSEVGWRKPNACGTR